jgi:two-component system cell cycle sensor histidine kinase/response regulator CckA
VSGSVAGLLGGSQFEVAGGVGMATILVVDDVAANRLLARTLLGYRGHAVLEAGDGVEALDVVRARHPDLVVTDALMPVMDGYELVHRLRRDRETSKIPVIFYTAQYLTGEVEPLAGACGVGRVIARSSDPAVLLDAVAQELAAPSADVPVIVEEMFTRQHLRAVSGKLVQKVHEQQAQQRALRESDERFRSMAELSPLGVLRLDRDNHAVYANPSLAATLGRPITELLGDGWLRQVSPDDRVVVLAAVDAGARPEGPRRITVIASNGESRRVEVYFSTMYDGQGQPIGSLRMFEDVTAQIEADVRRRELEDRLDAAGRLETLGRLASGAAHDFNNLLTTMLGHVELIRPLIDDEARAGHLDVGRASLILQDLDMVRQVGDRASHLVGQMLAVGRRETAGAAVVDLNAVLADLDGLVASAAGPSIRRVATLDPALRPVSMDAGHVGQVVLNLVVNARHAMPDGGVLTIETANQLIDADAEGYGDLPAGVYVRLSVRDTGHGMTPEVLTRATEPFFTTKAPGVGTGLGLAGVRGLVHEVAGDLVIESTPHVGTSVHVVLPAVQTDGARPETCDSSAVARKA